ncbi:MAG: response regulator [Calditrichaeota bacterium]|nr:response regulator [Calditrichota bacterium]
MTQKTCLVVDDDYGARLLVQKILEKEGYHITLASGGHEALEYLKKDSCDLMISDLKMEGMDGIELLNKVKQSEPNLSVIILTGHASIQTAIEALRLGAVDYLTKPVNADELRIRVKKAIERINLENRLTEIERQLTYNATVTTANHEINQPLTVILSGVDMIKMEFDKKHIGDKKILNYLNLIEKSSLRIANILRSFREISTPVIQKIPHGMRMIELRKGEKYKHASEKYILVIEDEEQIRILIRDMLESAGYHVILASNAHEGIEIYESQKNVIDLVLLDYYLPDSSGLQVFRKIREVDKNSHILLTSGFDIDDDIQKALDEGAIGFLSKPFNREQIVNFIQQLTIQ